MKFNFSAPLFLIFILNTSSIAQQPGFNIIDDLGYPNNELYKMIVHNDTIYGAGLAYDTTISSMQGILVVKYDTMGNLLQHKMIFDSLNDHLAMDKYWGKMIPTSDGGFAFNAATIFRHSSLLIKMNNNLEIDFIKEYADSNLVSNFNSNVLEVDNGYIIYGTVQLPSLVVRPYIRWVDKLGETIWENLYGDHELNGNMLDVEMLNDSVLVAGSVQRLFSNNSGIARNVLYFVHLDGTLLDDWYSTPTPSIGYLRELVILDDGGIMIYGLANVDGSDSQVKSTFSKLDQDLSIIWTKKYGFIKNLSVQIIFREIEPTIDGNYIAAGESLIQIGNEPDNRVGWLMKLSPEGDSIWSRYDRHDELPPFDNNIHGFVGVGVLSSGSIIAGGTVSEGADKHIWLVKVTNDGCLETIDCGLVPTYSPVPNVDISVFPNPCKESVNVVVDDYLPNNAKVALFNSVGQLLKTQPILSGWNNLKMDDQPPGIYFYGVRENNKVLKTGKLVKVQ